MSNLLPDACDLCEIWPFFQSRDPGFLIPDVITWTINYGILKLDKLKDHVSFLSSMSKFFRTGNFLKNKV